MSNRACVVALSLLALSGLANAQLVTPPTEAPAKTEPLPLPPAEAFKGPAMDQPVAPPVRQAPPADVIPPDLTWEKLVKLDEQGKLIRLTTPAEAAAIAVNPLLNDKSRAAANDYLAERLKTFENLVIVNLDIAEELDSEKLTKLNIGDKEQLRWWTGASAPFKTPVAPGPISVELTKRGVFSTLQQKVNIKIAKEYTTEEYKDTIKAAEAVAGHALAQLETVPYLLRDQGVGEPLLVRRNLMIEASGHLATILPSFNLAGDAATQALDVAAAVAGATSNADRLAAMERLRTILSTEQRRELLKKSIERRAASK